VASLEGYSITIRVASLEGYNLVVFTISLHLKSGLERATAFGGMYPRFVIIMGLFPHNYV
jgi:hypothetical protein